MKPVIRPIICVSLFAIAMGFLESAVVIYLRGLYYKDGFAFPLRPMPFSTAVVEVLREAATVVMLVCLGYLAGKTKLQRFAYFNLAFAVWDIFYYVFLYVFLGWPQSLFTWDLLFLIPLPWVGPVWAPCLLALLMIAGSVLVIARVQRDPLFSLPARNWLFMISGASICILAFMWDYLSFCTNYFSPRQALFSDLSGYVPQSFNYLLFFTGFAGMGYPVLLQFLSKHKSIA